MAIVHSMNQAVFDSYGAARPDPKLCQQLGEILKKKFPGTFGIEEAVKTDFGTLRLPKSKGNKSVYIILFLDIYQCHKI